MAKPRSYYQALARKYARAEGVPEDVYLAQLNQESGFNPAAHSYADARGIAQIVPRWHPDVNPNMKGNQLPGVNPEWDIAYGAHLMSSKYKQYGSWEQALSAYNSGRPDTYKDPSFAKGQTYNYVKNIMAARNQYKVTKGQTNETFADEYSQDALPTVSTTDDDLKKRAMAQWIMSNNKAFSEGRPAMADPTPFLMQAHAQEAQDLGLDGGTPADPGVQVAPGPIKGAAYDKVIQAIKYAQGMGLRVSENPYVDKVDPVHVKGSDHYRTYKGTNVGHAVDVSGDPNKLKAYFSYLEKNYGGSLDDMFYTPMGYSYDEGKRWNSTIKHHQDHVHASFY